VTWAGPHGGVVRPPCDETEAAAGTVISAANCVAGAGTGTGTGAGAGEAADADTSTSGEISDSTDEDR
jgi:hypothetical protein